MEKIKVITTNERKKQYWQERELPAAKAEDVMHVVNLYPEVEYQHFRGFGGAFTEASAHNYAGIPAFIPLRKRVCLYAIISDRNSKRQDFRMWQSLSGITIRKRHIRE